MRLRLSDPSSGAGVAPGGSVALRSERTNAVRMVDVHGLAKALNCSRGGCQSGGSVSARLRGGVARARLRGGVVCRSARYRMNGSIRLNI